MMNTTCRVLAALVVSTALQGVASGFVLAQGGGSAPSASGATAAYGDVGPGNAGEATAPEDAPPLAERPVLYVTGVEVQRSTLDPKSDIVRVTGLVSSYGWSAPQLVPTYAGKPFDDILDLELIATVPDQSQSATGFVPIVAIFPLEPGQAFKGVRVRAAENAITETEIPGSAQASITVNDCRDCMGKTLVSGSQAPTGQPSAVRQEDLPKSLRLIRPSDGIHGAEQDPNRLTLMLNENGVIEDAFWE